MDAIGSAKRLMPHLPLSLQGGDDMILKRMKRRHLRDDAIAFCKATRALRPDMTFGADIIAGFPTETEAMFRNSLELVEECDLTWLHVFPYSERPGTPAAKMPQLPGDVRKARAAELRAAGAAQVERFLDAQIGSVADVLVEQDAAGRTPQFANVRIDGAAAEGVIVPARIVARDNDTLIAQKAA